MGKAARLRQKRRNSREIILTFCDFDFSRASRAHGAGVRRPIPPEGWAIGRVGLVHAAYRDQELHVIGDEILEGASVGSATVAALNRSQLVIGHGVLASDYRALAMVTDVPESLLAKTIDTLALVHRLRGGAFPAGCGLSDLALLNLGERRVKPFEHASAPGIRQGMPKPVPVRGNHDPRDDSLLVARLWSHLVHTRRVSWAAAKSGWASQVGDASWHGTAAGAAELSDTHVAELLGRQRQVESAEWAERLHRRGQVLLPTSPDDRAASLAGQSAANLPDLSMLREIAAVLEQAGEVAADAQLSDEQLLTACQFLSANRNREVRARVILGRPLTKELKGCFAWALWQSVNVAFLERHWGNYDRGGTATGLVRWMESKNDLQMIQARIKSHWA